jgi:hypothetical protein
MIRRNFFAVTNFQLRMKYGCIVDDQEAAAFPSLPTAVAR